MTESGRPSWTCGTGRRRCRPANGTRWPLTGSIRPSPRPETTKDRHETREHGTGLHHHGVFSDDTPDVGGQLPRNLWTTGGPRVRELLAFQLPSSPTARDLAEWAKGSVVCGTGGPARAQTGA